MVIEKYKEKFNQEIEKLKKELSKIRTGRASSALLESIFVEAYGVKTPILQLANISIPEPRVMVIQPWDKSIVKDMEKAISISDLGASVKNEGDILRVILPDLTEESRKKLVKLVGERMEKTRIALRLIRDEAKEEIKKMESAKEITEDDKYSLIEELDKTIKEFNAKIEEIGKKKEEEIMTV